MFCSTKRHLLCCQSVGKTNFPERSEEIRERERGRSREMEGDFFSFFLLSQEIEDGLPDGSVFGKRGRKKQHTFIPPPLQWHEFAILPSPPLSDDGLDPTCAIFEQLTRPSATHSTMTGTTDLMHEVASPNQ